ncbi:MAG: hypothetical protein ACR2M3_05715 [Thermomicrobiales bacterium]
MREWHRTLQAALAFGRSWMDCSSRERIPSAESDTVQVEVREKIFYDAVMQQLDWQIRSGDALDLKIATWFTLTTVLLPVVAALLSAEHNSLDKPAVFLALAGALVWAVIVGLLYRAYIPNEWETGPRLDEFERAVRTHDARAIYLANAHFIATDSIPENESLLRKKARRLNWAVRLFSLEIILFGLAVTINLKR